MVILIRSTLGQEWTDEGPMPRLSEWGFTKRALTENWAYQERFLDLKIFPTPTEVFSAFSNQIVRPSWLIFNLQSWDNFPLGRLCWNISASLSPYCKMAEGSLQVLSSPPFRFYNPKYSHNITATTARWCGRIWWTALLDTCETLLCTRGHQCMISHANASRAETDFPAL